MSESSEKVDDSWRKLPWFQLDHIRNNHALNRQYGESSNAFKDMDVVLAECARLQGELEAFKGVVNDQREQLARMYEQKLQLQATSEAREAALRRIGSMEPDQHSRTCWEMHRIANAALSPASASVSSTVVDASKSVQRREALQREPPHCPSCSCGEPMLGGES